MDWQEMRVAWTGTRCACDGLARDACERLQLARRNRSTHTRRANWLDEVIIEVRPLFFRSHSQNRHPLASSSLCIPTLRRGFEYQHTHTLLHLHTLYSSFELISLSLNPTLS